jgi:serine/threonine protein kinase
LVQQVITIKLIFCFDFFVLFRYVISELCVGTLHDIVCGGYPMLNDNRMAMLQQITLALEHLHTNGIIHRDLKPSNILVLISSGTGLAVWKLADFGIFRIVQGERSKHTLVKGRSKLFRASGIKGWIAPEMLLSNMSFSC